MRLDCQFSFCVYVGLGHALETGYNWNESICRKLPSSSQIRSGKLYSKYSLHLSVPLLTFLRFLSFDAVICVLKMIDLTVTGNPAKHFIGL